MKKQRIAVLVSGGGTNLQALIDAEKSGALKSGTICAVISSSAEAYALKRAEKAGVCGFVLSKKALGSQAAFEQALQSILEQNEIDLIVLAGFLTILTGTFTKKWQNRILNVHPSLIPSFCGKGMYGLRVHEAALSYGVKVSGATVHFVNEVPDGGEIILQKAVEVLENDTPETLQRRIMEQAEWVLLPAATEQVCRALAEKTE